MFKSSTTNWKADSTLTTSLFATLTVFSVMLSKLFNNIVSPWDELYHLAHIQYIYSFVIPRPGTPILGWSKYAFSCFPVHPFGLTTSIPCGIEGNTESYPGLGRNTASGWPPFYYFLSSIWIRVFNNNNETALYTARTFSAVIWSLGIGLFCFTLIKINGFDNRNSFWISILIGVLPMGLFQGSFVTPYSIIPVIIALNYYLFSMFTKLRSKNFFLINVVSVISIFTIPHVLPVIFLLNVWIITMKYGDFHVYRLIKILISLAPTFLAVVSNYAWNSFQASRAIDVQTQSVPANPFMLSSTLNDFFTFIPHSIDGYQFLNSTQFTLSYLFGLLFMFLLFQPFFHPKSSKSLRITSGIVFLSSGIFGILEHFYFGFTIPPRYGLPFIFIGILLTCRFEQSVYISRFIKVLALASICSALYFPIFGAGS